MLQKKKQKIYTLRLSQYLIGIFLLFSCGKNNKGELVSQSKSQFSATFAGSASCIECHQEQYLSWKNSHHDLAMKLADSTTVSGNFDNISFSYKGITSKFFKKEKDFYVNTVGSDGRYQDYKITYTFGTFPLQQYIIEFPDGAFQCLDIAWDSKDQKWFHFQPDIEIKPAEWIHWTGGAMRWNTACADCHSTDLRKNYDETTNSFNTTFSEINVGCEACHGPAGFHLNYYQNNEKKEKNKLPKLKMDSSLTSKALVQQCARCHSRRSQITSYFDYTGTFLDHYDPHLITAGLYEPDGQILDEVYVYGSFVQSKMYHNGVSCSDCHNVHSLKLKKTGNALCLDCHDEKYDEPDHHFHLPDSEASKCINCHATGKYYMGNDFRRDHSFRVPRPDQSVLYDTPNACNNCHQDKSAKWASAFIIEKYGRKRPEHFSDLLLAGYSGNRDALNQLISESKYPEIARATALNYFAQDLTPADIDDIRLYLLDSSTLVRKEAILSLNGTGNNFTNLIIPLLKDSSRMVRIAAARNIHNSGFNTSNTDGYEKAHREYLNSLNANADFPAGQQNLARYYEASGDINKAISAYKKVIEFDNYFNPARMNLALLLYQKGEVAAAENLYLKVVEQEPEFGYAYYMLGLLYNESGETSKALDYLKYACKKEPVNFKAFYNYALLLQKENQNETSIKIIEKATESFPKNEQLLYVKLIGQLNLNLKKEALKTCQILLQIAPDQIEYRRILERLKY